MQGFARALWIALTPQPPLPIWERRCCGSGGGEGKDLCCPRKKVTGNPYRTANQRQQQREPISTPVFAGRIGCEIGVYWLAEGLIVVTPMHELFQQQPPTLANQYADDRVLRSFLLRALPPAVLAQAAPE